MMLYIYLGINDKVLKFTVEEINDITFLLTETVSKKQTKVQKNKLHEYSSSPEEAKMKWCVKRRKELHDSIREHTHSINRTREQLLEVESQVDFDTLKKKYPEHNI